VLAKKLGSCVDRARPYYDACKQAEEVKIEQFDFLLTFIYDRF